MENINTKILLIEDDPGDARLVVELLSEVKKGLYEVEWQNTLTKGLKYIEENDVEIILLDLMLPDSWGMESFNKVKANISNIPIIILTGCNDENIAVRAVQRGAQDYISKDDISPILLEHSIRYAIERQKMLAELKALSVVDELTGLYNRRGFLTLAQQQMEFADRNLREMLLFFIDFDGLKKINDNFGHNVGDIALMETANILKESFSRSDIISRIGGDEFAVLALEARTKSIEILIDRLQRNIEVYNKSLNYSFRISVSIGYSRYGPKKHYSIDELFAQADEMMYNCKNKKYKNPKENDKKSKIAGKKA
ncbi:GGDEF domain-containing response regulator [bacterium]|nr:GGDEF domain-containing response regulator [bacterium]